MDQGVKEVPVRYRALDKKTGAWLDIDDLLIARAYDELGWKVQTLYARPFNKDEAVSDAVSILHRQYDSQGDSDMPDESKVRIHREPAPDRGESNPPTLWGRIRRWARISA